MVTLPVEETSMGFSSCWGCSMHRSKQHLGGHPLSVIERYVRSLEGGTTSENIIPMLGLDFMELHWDLVLHPHPFSF